MITREVHGDVVLLRLGHGRANALDTELCEALRAALVLAGGRADLEAFVARTLAG